MKAEIQPSYDEKRKKLLNTIPLDSPIGRYIEPTKKCNFRCFYCMHSTRGIGGGKMDREGFKVEDINPELY